LPGIFISYRREDSEDSTRAIYESLVPRFGRERLFLDVEAIKPGADFRNSIEESLADCGVFLVVIGPNWANIKPDNDPSGPRRLDIPSDFVRQEVATALRKGESLPVIPVLVRGASMPAAEAEFTRSSGDVRTSSNANEGRGGKERLEAVPSRVE